MKKAMLIFILLGLSSQLLGQEAEDVKKEKAAIKEVIVSAYLEGISNKGDIDAVQKGFHPGFTMFGINNNSLWTRPLYNWIESVERGIKEGKYPPEDKVTFEFPMMDVTGNAAVAKVKYSRGGKLAYTDYLSLYKFEDGWKIVAKVFHSHS